MVSTHAVEYITYFQEHGHWPAPSSSVLPIETNVGAITPPPCDRLDELEEDPPPPPPSTGNHDLRGHYDYILPTKEEVHLRHDCWLHRRRQIRDALSSILASRNRLIRWDSCGSQAMLSLHRSKQWVLCQAFCCHDRFCQPCSKAKSLRVAANISRQVRKATTRFMTLTLTHDSTPLIQQIDRLYRSFRTLRADSWWDNNVSGGCAFLEVTRNQHTHQWHPHLHPLVQGRYVPQAVLSRKWLAITGNSPIVHITLIPDVERLSRYVSKYASKGMDDSVFTDPNALQEWITASAGRRLCTTIGSWRGWKLNEHTPLDMTHFTKIGSLTEVTRNAACGDAAAIKVLTLCRRNLRWSDLNPTADTDGGPFLD